MTMTERLTELFVFYRDGIPHHFHSNRAMFEEWMEKSPWLYPRQRCEIARFVPAAPAEQSLSEKEG